MTLENVVWLLAGWIATNAVLAAAWAWWRRPRDLRGDIERARRERARRDNGRESA
jgi:hypothetical protein